MQLVFRIKSGDRGQPVADGMRRIANGLVERGAAVVIAGCTEIPLVLSAAQIAAPLLSSTDVLAERTVAYCRGSMSLPG
jgi:aspartate racemase